MNDMDHLRELEGRAQTHPQLPAQGGERTARSASCRRHLSRVLDAMEKLKGLPRRVFRMIAPCLPRLSGIAGDLHAAIEALPIVSPHGHCDPEWWGKRRGLPRPGGAAGDAGSLPSQDALFAGRTDGAARRRQNGRGPRQSRDLPRLRAGTGTRFWARPRGCGWSTRYTVSSVWIRSSRPIPQILYMIRWPSGLSNPAHPAAGAVRQLRDRDTRHDRSRAFGSWPS